MQTVDWNFLVDLLIDEVKLIKNTTNSTSKWLIVGRNPGSYNSQHSGYFNCLAKQLVNKKIVCQKRGEMEDGNFYYGNQLFDRKLEKVNDIDFIDPYDVYCDQRFCYNYINQNLVYVDNGHLTYLSSKILVDQIIVKIIDN